MIFRLGLLVGILINNLSLGLFTASLTVLLIGINRTGNFITLLTILVVKLTGNINFELIYILVISVAYIIKIFETEKMNIGKRHIDLIYIISGGLIIILSPVLRELLGVIPAGVLNDINIAGEIILLNGIIFAGCRIIYSIMERDWTDSIVMLIAFIMAFIGIKGTNPALYIWPVGILLITYLQYSQSVKNKIQRINFLDKRILSKAINYLKDKLKDNLKVYLKDSRLMMYIITVALVYLAIYTLLPLTVVALLIGLIFLIYIYLRPESWYGYRLDIIYLSLMLGLMAARTGLLS